jgi:hypothetical protein
MIGTLVVTLPSSHTGGELIVDAAVEDLSRVAPGVLWVIGRGVSAGIAGCGRSMVHGVYE